MARHSPSKKGVASLAYVPAIHVFVSLKQDVDARHKACAWAGQRPDPSAGHDEKYLLGRPSTAMRMMMAMVVIVVMMVILIMAVRMIMRVAMIVIMMVQPLARTGPARILAEDQRLDGHRHREGRIADAAEINIVEVPQHHAVDHQELARHPHLVPQDVAERLRHVAVEHDVERLARRDARRQGKPDSFREGGEPLIGGHARPAERERAL